MRIALTVLMFIYSFASLSQTTETPCLESAEKDPMKSVSDFSELIRCKQKGGHAPAAKDVPALPMNTGLIIQAWSSQEDKSKLPGEHIINVFGDGSEEYCSCINNLESKFSADLIQQEDRDKMDDLQNDVYSTVLHSAYLQMMNKMTAIVAEDMSVNYAKNPSMPKECGPAALAERVSNPSCKGKVPTEQLKKRARAILQSKLKGYDESLEEAGNSFQYVRMNFEPPYFSHDQRGVFTKPDGKGATDYAKSCLPEQYFTQWSHSKKKQGSEKLANKILGNICQIRSNPIAKRALFEENGVQTIFGLGGTFTRLQYEGKTALSLEDAAKIDSLMETARLDFVALGNMGYSGWKIEKLKTLILPQLPNYTREYKVLSAKDSKIMDDICGGANPSVDSIAKHSKYNDMFNDMRETCNVRLLGLADNIMCSDPGANLSSSDAARHMGLAAWSQSDVKKYDNVEFTSGMGKMWCSRREKKEKFLLMPTVLDKKFAISQSQERYDFNKKFCEVLLDCDDENRKCKIKSLDDALSDSSLSDSVRDELVMMRDGLKERRDNYISRTACPGVNQVICPENKQMCCEKVEGEYISKGKAKEVSKVVDYILEGSAAPRVASETNGGYDLFRGKENKGAPFLAPMVGQEDRLPSGKSNQRTRVTGDVAYDSFNEKIARAEEFLYRKRVEGRAAKKKRKTKASQTRSRVQSSTSGQQVAPSVTEQGVISNETWGDSYVPYRSESDADASLSGNRGIRSIKNSRKSLNAKGMSGLASSLDSSSVNSDRAGVEAQQEVTVEPQNARSEARRKAPAKATSRRGGGARGAHSGGGASGGGAGSVSAGGGSSAPSGLSFQGSSSDSDSDTSELKHVEAEIQPSLRKRDFHTDVISKIASQDIEGDYFVLVIPSNANNPRVAESDKHPELKFKLRVKRDSVNGGVIGYEFIKNNAANRNALEKIRSSRVKRRIKKFLD